MQYHIIQIKIPKLLLVVRGWVRAMKLQGVLRVLTMSTLVLNTSILYYHIPVVLRYRNDTGSTVSLYEWLATALTPHNWLLITTVSLLACYVAILWTFAEDKRPTIRSARYILLLMPVPIAITMIGVYF